MSWTVAAPAVALSLLVGFSPAAAQLEAGPPDTSPVDQLLFAAHPDRVVAGTGGATFEGTFQGFPVLCRATLALSLAKDGLTFAASQDVPAVLGTQGVCQALLTQRYTNATHDFVSLPSDRIETGGGNITLRGTRDFGAHLRLHLWLNLEHVGGAFYHYEHTVRSSDGNITLAGEGHLDAAVDLFFH